MATKKTKALPYLMAALDEESFNWLSDNLPALCEALETELARGAKPEALAAELGEVFAGYLISDRMAGA